MTTHSAPPLAPPSPSPWAYSRPAVVLHWLIAALLAAAAAVGWYMTSIEDEPGTGWYFSQHKSVGLLIALLVLARIVWRLKKRPQVLPATVPRWQVLLSTGNQVALYLAMALMPLTGFLGASYSKRGVQFFGIETPRWAVPDHDTAEQFFDLHSALVWLLLALVALHVAGALKHLLLDKDGVFERMWFRPQR